MSIPKILHTYWDSSPLPFLNYMTLVSFLKFNPDWEILLHVPIKKSDSKPWSTDEQRGEYIGRDYFQDIKGLPKITINVIDFDAIGFSNNQPEVFKSDYLRWYLLSTIGGGWSDMDILYLTSINKIAENTDMVICNQDYGNIIGFLLSKSNNVAFDKILKSITKHFDESDYQTIGSKLFNKVYPTVFDIINVANIRIRNLTMDVFYPINHENITKIFNEDCINMVKPETIGVHWYNGSQYAKEFNNTFPDENIKNTITSLLKRIE